MTLKAIGTIAGALLLGTSLAHGATWDTNDDGSVDAKEFATGQSSAATFNRFDDNRDGAITPNELGLDSPDETFQRADNDGDGTLTPGELSAATFSTYDRDRDGYMRDDEWMMFEYDEGRRNSPFADWEAPRVGSEVSQ